MRGASGVCRQLLLPRRHSITPQCLGDGKLNESFTNHPDIRSGQLSILTRENRPRNTKNGKTRPAAISSCLPQLLFLSPRSLLLRPAGLLGDAAAWLLSQNGSAWC